MECMKQQGLYYPGYEHDACGVGLLADMQGVKSHAIVEKGLQVLEHMVHRGAEGADPKTGDGAGILLQIPHEFILLQGIPVPEKGRYGTGMVFFPKDAGEQEQLLESMRRVITGENLTLLAIRDVPVNSEILGAGSRAAEPAIKQVFVTGNESGPALERKLYVLRKKMENRVAGAACNRSGVFYIASLSSQTIVYKGMFSTEQLRYYYPDLINPYFTSGLALVHSRFSTNTFPSWSLAQPFRLLGHNGEINTIRGNRLWSEARESVLRSKALGEMSDLVPILQPGMSDSASLDNVLEFFVRSGMSLPHALAMLIPESFNDKNPISPRLKAFYEYHSIWMEPWDGPATLLFADGRYAGGMLDRNGLRPGRYLITKNGLLVVASETGVLPFDASEIKEHGRLKPGKMLLLDMEKGEICEDVRLKEELAAAFPYGEWLAKNRIKLEQVSSGRRVRYDVDEYERQLRVFGYRQEDVIRVMVPMVTACKEPVGAMGNDTPLAVFSQQTQRLFNYFRQQFAQVTNPPIDPLREELVMSLSSYIGVIGHNLLDASPELCKMVELKSPVLTNRDVDLLCNLRYKGFRTRKLATLFDIRDGTPGMEKALDNLCREAERAVDEDYNYLILTDRYTDVQHAPLPSLLAVSAVHHYLIAKRKRVQTALIIETGEAREAMHFALLAGYGASAVNPYLAFAVINELVQKKEIQLDYHTAEANYIEAVNKGLLKIISKMGISTLSGYRGAALFEAVGLSPALLDTYFYGTASPVGGVGMEELCADALADHREAYGAGAAPENELRNAGLYGYRRNGEYHAWNPPVVAALQAAVRAESYEKFKEYTALADKKPVPVFLRDFLGIKQGIPVPLAEVEPIEAIVKRFVTGAMSFGSISKEAHEAMAVAMNLLGARSNSGEGGEEAERFVPRPDGTTARSAIKQVASGRFGVTAAYLANADEIQIKIAQGAKPGEGGQLPGFKVDEVIARTRHSLPGISLISPPPHHDIYSIEDLAQLIFDLKNVNPRASVSVKLVSESGVGTIAAGVAKAKADSIVISGSEGGTGASPLSSTRYAGLPAEIGLAETQQTLVLNNLRGQVKLQVDGELKTGRDIIVQALLGAEEYGFATSVLVVLGCMMTRTCHKNTCPVGIATQNPELRKRFKGEPVHVVTFFRYLAGEVREYLAAMGFRSLDEIIGRSDLLVFMPQTGAPKAGKLDFSRLLYRPAEAAVNVVRNTVAQQHKLETVIDRMLIKAAYSALEQRMPVELHFPIRNTDRATGAMLSGCIALRFGDAGLPGDTIRCTFAGSAGQSFGAFLAHGVSFRLEGDANDYLGKGLSGGKIVVVPPQGATFVPEENVIAGNTLLYGATSGEVYLNGQVGERFCVRNSGAIAVAEGAGDHCCEYMTGGRTVVLGTVGRNFAAGMSGGIAYVWNKNGDFDFFCNMETVELSLIEDEAAERELQRLISAHYTHTGSPLAKEILGRWPVYVKQFIRVMPVEYKKVLLASLPA